MVDANENDKAPKSESSPGKDAVEKDEAPLNLSNDVQEEEDDDDEDDYEFDEDEEDGDEEEDEEDDDEEEAGEEPKEEKVDEGGNAVAAVKSEGVETNKENADKEDGKKVAEPKSDKKSAESSKSKEKRPRNRKSKKNEQKDSGTLAANGDKPESSKKKKASKRVESMGMVFMCSSKTKADCFRYKILGLPENKKDQVLKIYRGMRLFLFDVDLRLMYGIFKAAGPGGYNIEPNAFKSEFPSQVRFTVLDDCLPLAEENFKSILKENYYSRNKFEGLLKSEQVKKLCKLFVEKGRGGGRSRSANKSRRSRPIESRRTRPDESRRNRLDDRRTSRAQEKRKRRARDEERRPRSPPPREKRRYIEYDRPPVLYDLEPPVPRYLPPQPPAIGSPVRLYTYEREPLDVPPYVRDHLPEPRTYRVVERDRDRDRDRDPYLSYGREAPPPLYRDAVYTVPPEYQVVGREYHHPPAIQTPEYRISSSHVPNYRDVEIGSDYRSAAAALPEYRSRTHYRY